MDYKQQLPQVALLDIVSHTKNEKKNMEKIYMKKRWYNEMIKYMSCYYERVVMMIKY